MKKHLTATDLFNYAKCSHRPYMDIHGDQSLKVEIHPLVKLLWESGVQYEAKVIESLKKDNPDKSFAEIVKNQWEELPKRFSGIELNEFIIMPNHVHGILITQTEPVGAPLAGALMDLAPAFRAPARGAPHMDDLFVNRKSDLL